MQAVQAAQASLDDFDTLPPLGTDAVRINYLYSKSKLIDFTADMSSEQCILYLDLSPGFFSSFLKASQAWRKNKMDESKHEIHSQVDAITAGTASMVNLTAGRKTVPLNTLLLFLPVETNLSDQFVYAVILHPCHYWSLLSL